MDFFSGLLSGGLGFFFDSLEADFNNQLTKERMDKQNILNKDYFDYVAEYNSPINQRLRAGEAGLNPNWADISQQTVLSGSSAPTSVGASTGPAQMVSSFANLKNSQTQQKAVENLKDLQDKQGDEAEAKAEEAKANARKLNADAQRTEEENSEGFVAKELNRMDSEVEQIQAKTKELQVNKEFLEVQKNSYREKIEAEMFELISRGEMEKAEASYKKLMEYYDSALKSSETKKNLAEVIKWQKECAIAMYNAQTNRTQVEYEHKDRIVSNFIKSQEVNFYGVIATATSAYYGSLKKKTDWEGYVTSLQAVGENVHAHVMKFAEDIGLPYAERLWLNKELHNKVLQSNAKTSVAENDAEMYWVHEFEKVIGTLTGGARDLGSGYYFYEQSK